MRITREPETTSGFLFTAPFDDFPALTHCGDAICSPRHFVASHQHEGFELIYLSRGRAAWSIGDQTFTQRPGELFFTTPRQRHGSQKRRDGQEFHHLWTGLVLERLGDEGARLAGRLLARSSPVIRGCEEVEPILQGVTRQLLLRGPNRQEVVVRYLETFVAVVHQCLSAEEASPARTEAPFSYSVERALAYMAQTWERRLTLAELARVAGASVSHLCLLFRRQLGVTPQAHHLAVRLDHARRALRQPDSAIADVALAHGFSSSQHFSTAFRRAFGQTPKEWMEG